MDIILHSRHIPREHLDFSAPAATTVENNGLCDVLQKQNLKILKENNVSVLETRLTWYELDTQNPNRWDRLSSAISAIKTSGLKVGLFCWFQYPPENIDIVKLQCLEHQETSSIASLWDEKTLQAYDALYQELSKNFGSEIDFIYIGVYGDYGEVCFPAGVKHYKFSPKHGHEGFFCADSRARTDFTNYLKRHYCSIDELNKSWDSSFSSWDNDLMPTLPFVKNQQHRRIDFSNWYTGSITKFCNSVCEIANKWFPNTPKGLPIGHPDEKLCVGQIKSDIVKVAAKHNCFARWTGLAFLCNFGKSDVLAKRISSPANFYGAPFGTEAALTLNFENVVNAMYENIANGSQMLHNDLGNFIRGGDLWGKHIKNYHFSLPSYNTAIFYPLEGELLEELKIDSTNIALPFEEEFYNIQENSIEKSFSASFNTPRNNQNENLSLNPIELFITRCAALRHHFDYTLTDSTMIRDGHLDKLQNLFFVISTTLPKATCNRILQWVQNGGKILTRKGVQLTILETGETFNPLSSNYDEAPKIEPYYSLKKLFSTGSYITVHKDFVSVFDENNYEIKIIDFADIPDGIL